MVRIDASTGLAPNGVRSGVLDGISEGQGMGIRLVTGN